MAGFSTDRLLESAASVGLDDSTFVQCVEDESDADGGAQLTPRRPSEGSPGPIIFVDGTLMNLDATQTAGAFRAEVAAPSG